MCALMRTRLGKLVARGVGGEGMARRAARTQDNRSSQKIPKKFQESQALQGRIEESPSYVDAMTAPLHPGGCFLRER
jgi:hypothetical protein